MMIRILILTIALIAPGLLPAVCSTGVCGPIAKPVCTTTYDLGPVQATSACCSARPVAAPRPATPSAGCCQASADAPRPCCCVVCPVTGPRAPPTAPHRPTQNPEDPGVELPRPWPAAANLADPAPAPPDRRTAAILRPPGGANPIQSVLCIWRN